MKSNKRLFLIDGSSFCYRAFYAVRELTTSKGQPTNAIYGVISMLRKLIEAEAPDYLAVAFDLPEPTFRHKKYEGYKEHRAPMPDALQEQMPWIKKVLQAFEIPIFEVAGYEADDVLGTLATGAAKSGASVYLVTGDKDALQLLGPKIKMYRPTRDGYEIVDEKALKSRWQVRPNQVVDVMALMGDAVDEIPGVTGIGEKTALELIQQFGSVEKLLQAVGKKGKNDSKGNASVKIRPAVLKAIQEQTDQLMMSLELVKCDTQVPVRFGLKDLERKDPDEAELAELFRTLEFKSLAREFQRESEASSVDVKPFPGGADFAKLERAIQKAGRMALVLAWEGTSSEDVTLLGVGVAVQAGGAWMGQGATALKQLKSLCENPKLTKVAPQLKETLLRLESVGIALAGPCSDPTIASYLLDPARSSHQVPDLSLEFLDVSVGDPDPLRQVALQAEAALALTDQLEVEVQKKNLAPLMQEVEIPLAGVLARMEAQGIAVDLKAFATLAKETDHSLKKLTGEIHKLAGEVFNINSSKQLAYILFEKLNLPVIKRTKTGASTNEEVLVRLSDSHKLPEKILAYRELAKLSSTYVQALPKLVNPKTQRIHASFNQTVTATGRLSASNPNLQNIPIRTELGRQVRRGFVPSQKSLSFLAADYSQVELRILAHLSGDKRLIEAFRKGVDVHQETAAQVFGVSPEKVTEDQRAAAKTINFGIIYGMTAFGLSRELQVAPSEAGVFIEGYFAQYPGVKKYVTESLAQAKKKGYCVTLFGRRRYIPELKAKQQMVRQFAERTAVNAPIQGSAADLIKFAMVSIDEAIRSKKMRSRMLIQVHDELVFEAPQSEMKALQTLVQNQMEAPTFSGKKIKLKVPIQVNMKTGRDWLEVSHA